MGSLIRHIVFWSMVLLTIPVILGLVLFIWFISTIVWVCQKTLSWFNV